MAKVSRSFTDNKGDFHRTPEAATISDIAAALGRLGEDGGMAAGVARLILDKRKDIEAAFADHDAMMSQIDE